MKKINELLDTKGIKAETLITMLNVNENLHVQTKGVFSRNYSEDLLVIDYEKDRTTIEVARDGIFHLLPQGIFFSENLLAGNSKSNFEFEKIYKELMRKKKDAMAFFQPFDTIFFKLTLELEQKLNALAQAGNAQLFDAFLDTSEIEEDNKYISAIKKLLPFANQIRGNLPLFTDILKNLFSCKKIEVQIISPLYKRFIIHKEGLNKKEYHEMESEIKPAFDFMRHWFLPVEQKFDYRIKDYTRPFKFHNSPILDYNTHFKYGKSS